MAPRAWIVGPDRNGLSVVIAGDKICWVGKGSPPPMPGASRLPCPTGEVGPGWAKSAAVVVHAPQTRIRACEEALRNLRLGFTTVMLLASGDEALNSDVLCEVAASARTTGIRLLVGAAPDPNPGSGLRAAECTREFIHSNRDVLVRGIYFASGWMCEAAIPAPRPLEAAGEPANAEELRVRELIVESGHEDLVLIATPAVTFSDPPSPRAFREFLCASEHAFGRRFGRRIGVLEVGAVGDCVVRNGIDALHAIVGGQLVLRDGEPPAPVEDRRRARWKREEPDAQS